MLIINKYENADTYRYNEMLETIVGKKKEAMLENRATLAASPDNSIYGPTSGASIFFTISRKKIPAARYHKKARPKINAYAKFEAAGMRGHRAKIKITGVFFILRPLVREGRA